MQPTHTEIESARETLEAEIELLNQKVADGKTLRCAERRFLLSIINPADDMKAKLDARMYALLDAEKTVCNKCKQKIREIINEVHKTARECGLGEWND